MGSRVGMGVPESRGVSRGVSGGEYVSELFVNHLLGSRGWEVTYTALKLRPTPLVQSGDHTFPTLVPRLLRVPLGDLVQPLVFFL